MPGPRNRHLRVLASPSHVGWLVLLLALAWTPSAFARLTCEEIMNMVNVNVPTNIIVQTMEDSGETFTSSDVRCLIQQGAPEDVVAAARRLSEKAAEPEPEPVREPQRRRDGFEDADALGGSRRSGRSAEDDLPEAGEVRGPRTACDRDVDEAVDALKARKPLAASKMLFEVLESGACKKLGPKVDYYLARSLFDLKMYHSAQYFFLRVIRRGPKGNNYFQHALPKLVAITRYTGDESDLMRIVPKIPPSAYPRRARNHLYYLMGVHLYNRNQLSEARKYFSQISTRSSLYLKARYFEGVIFNRQGRLKSAVKSFRDVIRDAEAIDIYTEEELRQVEDLTDLSLLNVARIYYSIQRFDQASKYYDLVPRDSRYWPQALFEHAWTLFMLNDLNRALGMLLTVNSPYFSDSEFIPEARYLRALTFFNLCEYNRVERELLAFEDWLRPMYQELKDFTSQYRSKEGKKLADRAYEAYFEDTPKGTSLPPSMFLRFLRNADLAGLIRHLDLMAEEERRIDAQKALWRDSVGEQLKRVLEADRQKLKRRAGLVLLSEMARMAQELGDLLTQSEIVRFEVVSAQRADYAYKMANPELADVTSNLDLDFATAVDFIYWPFNGEFWNDELGYYHYTEQGSCN